MRRATACAVLAISFVLTPAIGASAAVRIREVAVAGYPRVGVIVSTDDAVPLSAANVRVVENGVPASVEGVTLLSERARKVDAVLAIDVSNSVRGEELETAMAAATTFAQQLPTSIEVGVLTFSDEIHVVSPLSADHETALRSIAEISGTTAQGTALFDAVSAASGMFEGPGQHNVVVLTDGRNTAGDADLEAAVGAAIGSEASVFTFALESGDPDSDVLLEMSRATRGVYTALEPEDLGAAYESLAIQLSQQYMITYRSKSPPGIQAEVVVSAPGGTDRVDVLIPPPSVQGHDASQGFLAGVLQGDVGVVLVVGLTFLAALSVMALILSVTNARRRQHELEARLLSGQIGGRAGPIEHEATAWVPRPLAQAAEWGAETAHASGLLARQLDRAGWRIKVGDFLAPALLVPLAAGAIGFFLLGPLWGVLFAAVLLPFPFLILSHAGKKRIAALQAQLPDVLMVLASSLRAGHSFLQALDSVTKEVDDPAATEFARTLAAIQLGMDVDEALQTLAARAGSLDLEWAVTAINIQRKVGGNLAEVLETVANTIRQRETIRRQVKVLSAEGRYSVYILVALPFVILAYLSLVNPGYLEPLTQTPTGILLLIGGGLLMVIGFIWMRRIVRLHV